MNFEPEFINLDDVLDLHDLQLKRYGGRDGIRDLKLLESAVMTPQASFGGEYVHKDIFEMAAAYAFHIAENQPFVDGNKRTALASALVFLDINGIECLDPNGTFYQAMIDISAKKMNKAALGKLLKKLGESEA